VGTPSRVSQADVEAVVDIILTLSDSIKAAGPDGIPSGHLYAMVLQFLPNLSSFNFQLMIDKLKNAGLVKERAYLLTYIGD